MHRFALACLMIVGLCVSASAQEPAAGTLPPGHQIDLRDGFDADPQWEGFRNRLLPEPLPSAQQSFGYRTTQLAGGRSAGEIGGRIERSTTAASYAQVISECTLDDRLSASGRFSVTRAGGGSGVMFGWFHHTSRGWRTPNSLAFRIDGNGGKYWLFYEYGTLSGRTGGGGAFQGERYQTTVTPPFPADGTSHEWSLDYDPEAAGGRGLMSFRVDERQYELPLAPGHREEGATFDRFGFWNVQIQGDSLTAFMDDLTVNGERFEFDRDPGWEAAGNDGEFAERVIRPYHDFGHSATNHAGGETPGEMGGIVFRDERPAFYATPIESLTLEDELYASGKIALLQAASDSGVYLGWFAGETKRSNETAEHEARQQNYLGIMVEGPSRVGHYFRPAYGTATGAGVTSGPTKESDPPVIYPDGTVHSWWIRYTPQSGGAGRIVVGFDEQTFEFEVSAEHRQIGASFDHFGLFNIQSGGHHVQIYVDDLQVASRRHQQDGKE